MNNTQKSTFIAWLNDAHAMEEGLITILEKQVRETEAEPAMQARIKEHLEETREHAKLVRECIERHGEEPSGTKDAMSKMAAAVNGMGMSFMSDAKVKNVHSSYAAEHFEIATYTLIAAAATECGDSETADICERIMEEEHAMADWLLEQLPAVTVNHMSELAAEE